ncbi:MAG: threonine--tRNA ligase [Candidatus Saccharibacteria bacterium]
MSDAKLDKIRHSLAHIMAAAVQKLHKDAQFGVGPVIENGFYYDIKLEHPLDAQELKKVQKEMKKLISAKLDFVREEWPIEEAIKYFKEHKQDFKVELLNDLKTKGTTAVADAGDSELIDNSVDKITTVSVYKTGDFVDLCRGPHVKNTSEIDVDSFKLDKLAGAYWRGNENNPQMQRIYGVAFENKAGLDLYAQMVIEAEKRDHRKLGQQLDLFTFSDLVGPGLPLYTPKGTVLINQLKAALNEISNKYDMQPVSIPHLAKLDLYKISGHAEKFEDELFKVESHYKQEFVLKPVNCPHHTQIYASRPRSYRDLPIRYIEQTMQYRDEKPGQIGGLQRTRGFTVDDGHTFCRVDQIKHEAEMIAEIIESFYKNLGLWGNHWVSLSVRDPKKPEAYIGEPSDWDEAERMLKEIAEERGLDAKKMEGEAAIYGPKLDFMFKDALGRETQLATIQLDFAMPKRFKLVYTDQAGKEKHPVMIHRAILGSFERFIMLLIEHFAGAFPVWLAPEQVRVLPVSDKFNKYAKEVALKLREAGVRVETDDSSESLSKKIRNVEMMKVPYALIVGENEQKSRSVSVRRYGKGDEGQQKINVFITTLLKNISEKSLN